MQTQEELKIGIGTQENEMVALKPAKVKIVNVTIEPTKKSRKVVFECKHPDKEEPIHISSVARFVGRTVEVSGTWYNLDKENKLQKDSAVVVLLQRLGAATLQDAIGKEADTELEGKYLCFKAY